MEDAESLLNRHLTQLEKAREFMEPSGRNALPTHFYQAQMLSAMRVNSVALLEILRRIKKIEKRRK